MYALSPPAYFTDGIRFNFKSVAMELCRFAYLTCQHRELLRIRSPWVPEDRDVFHGEMNIHISPFQEQRGHVRVQACATLKACILELSMEGCQPVKVWCLL